MFEVVSYERVENIVVITIDNPPVNAMSVAVRQGLWELIEQFIADDEARSTVLMCAGRTFIAGADITEFDKPMMDPWLPELITKIEQSPKLIVAAIHGTALGGGLETAMGCHYRCALATAKVGLPEVNLGLLPGAGGTQRLPRLAGVKQALDMMLSGKTISAKNAKDCGIIDEIIEGDLREGAITYSRRLLEDETTPRRTSAMVVEKSDIDRNFFVEKEKKIAQQWRGFFSPGKIVKCVEAAVNLPFDEAMILERKLFDECKASIHSKAQLYLFFAERTVAKIPDVPKDTAVREINKVAIIGAGTMGGGVAMNFVNVGIPVTLMEIEQQALDRGIANIRKNYEGSVKKGRMTAAQLEQCMGLIHGALDYDAITDADLVIEAVFENMAIKKEVFKKLDEVCRPGAILATNTSTLDVDDIAASTTRPEDVIGLHFFAPANVMKLLEIVRGAKTTKDVIATAMAMAKRIRKTGVLSGVCFGFIGNRMFFPYIREAQMMMLEGIAPERIDQVAYDWGMAMSPNAVVDLSGVDVFAKIIQEWHGRPDDPVYCRMNIVLNEMGRLGQKTGAGIFKYDGRKPTPDPEVVEIARNEAVHFGIEQRDISDQEILERLLYSMINEGALILEEGIALRASDIDVVFISGYGLPRYRGGPMFYADTVGIKNVYNGICKYRDRFGDQYWTPAPLLEQLLSADKTFSDWSATK